MTCPRPRPSASPVLNVQSEPGNHSAWISDPTIRPKMDRTLDHANQYPKVATGPTSAR